MSKIPQGEPVAHTADPHTGGTPLSFPYARFSFYRPHTRSATWWTGEVTNPVTGEVSRPPTRTKQDFRDQCDINNIIKAYKITGQIQHISAAAAQGRFEDLPDPIDFQESLNSIRMADQAFAALPSKLRDRFGNDPTQFLSFLSDPENIDEARKLGIVNPLPATDLPPGGPPREPPPAAPPPAPEPPK
jgi:phage internal scaffolding protein